MPARQSPAVGAAGGFNAVQKLLTAWGTRLGECRPLAPGSIGVEALAVLQLAPSPRAVP
jgi:hypothetical protein